MKPTALAVLLVLAPSLAIAEDGEAAHAAVVAAVAKKACVPPAKVSVDGGTSYYAAYIADDNGALAACVSRVPNGDMGVMARPEKPFQCWTVDPKSNALAARPIGFMAGRSYAIPSACAEGYCKPKEKEDAHGELFAMSSDGAHAARITVGSIQIFDAKTKAFVREFPLLDDQGRGTGLAPTDIIYVGDTLIIVGFSAGPDAGAWIWNATKGTYVGPVGPPSTGETAGYVNLYAGRYELADATHFVAFDGGYEEATVDMTTGAVTMRVMPVPAVCSGEDWQAQQTLDIIGFGDKPKAKCTKAVRAQQKKFFPSVPTRGFVTVGGKGYKLQHGKKAELLVLGPKATKPKGVQLPICKVK